MERTLIKLPVISEVNKQQTNKNNQNFELGNFRADLYCSVIQIKIAVDLISFSCLLFEPPFFRHLRNTFVEML